MTTVVYGRVVVAVHAGVLCILSMMANVYANDFPTFERVLYVQECMVLRNSWKYETLYACSCMQNKIAEQMSYTEYVKADSYMRMRNARGERGAVFRSGERVRKIRKKFLSIKAKAEESCFIR